MLKGLIRKHKMALGIPSLRGVLLPHWKYIKLPKYNHGVSSTLHPWEKMSSRVLSKVLFVNPLNLVSIYSLILPFTTHWTSGIRHELVIELMILGEIDVLMSPFRCWFKSWGQNCLPSGYTYSAISVMLFQPIYSYCISRLLPRLVNLHIRGLGLGQIFLL